MKQCIDNPWSLFARDHNKGDKITGKIKSITDFGIFVGLDSGIDALIHLSDLSWDEPFEQVVRNYKKGQEIEAVVLSIDAERERISLGVKQLQQPESISVTKEENTIKEKDNSDTYASTKLGDILKEHINTNKEDSN
jgi:small subunit ribosomal protein S1